MLSLYSPKLSLVCLSALAAPLLVWSCATSPEKVEPAYVDPMEYRSYNCDQIAVSMRHRSRRIASLHSQMSDQASDDAAAVGVSMILFWPAAFLASGGNEAQVAEYKRLTGEYEALHEQSVLKECSLDVESPRERIAREQQQAKEDNDDKNIKANPQNTGDP